jgi:uncharacterized protein (TIGR02145 family)
MRYYFTASCIFLFSAWATAQSSLNIHRTDGTITVVATTVVDSVTHVQTPPEQMRVDLSDGSFIELPVTEVDSITYSPGGEDGAPLLATEGPSAISFASAACGGFIADAGGAPVTERGICWSTTPLPTIADGTSAAGDGTGEFSTQLSGLSPATTYYARAYATNAVGTAYGNMVSFTTGVDDFECGETFVDVRDGKVYTSLQMGNQCWMGENLKWLPEVSPHMAGSNTEPRYYVHGYTGTSVEVAMEQSTYITYGVLYNWTAAMGGAPTSDAVPSGVQGACPAGWHLPSDAEWNLLEVHLGMDPVDALGSNYRGTNEASKMAGSFGLWTNGQLRNDPEFGTSGLNFRPGGARLPNATYIALNGGARWWSSTQLNVGNVHIRLFSFVNSRVARNSLEKSSGFSVRCVKD